MNGSSFSFSMAEKAGVVSYVSKTLKKLLTSYEPLLRFKSLSAAR